MQDLTEFIKHSNEQLERHLDEKPGKYTHFNVKWNDTSYQVHYVQSKEKTAWEMMAYAKLN